MSLAAIAQIVGGIILGVNLVGVVAPDALMSAVKKFPRNRPVGWLLIGIDLFWVATVVLNAHLGRFEFLKPFVYAAAPISFFLIVFFMDELLAARALGGLLLLVANPVLNAARWHPSAWRYVLIVMAYLWVIAGILFVLSPYRFRQMASIATGERKRMRLLCGVKSALGVLILGLGLIVF